jgi:hypothetical protein
VRLQDAVTPFGSPETAKFTMPLKPFSGLTETAVTPEEPGLTVRALADSVNEGAATVRVKVVDAVRLPEVPVSVTVAFATGAEPLAVKVSVLLEVAGFREKDAVTPAGRPERERLTVPLNPYSGVTLTEAEVVLPWPTLRLVYVETVKVGA